jgi:hypothetical protein
MENVSWTGTVKMDKYYTQSRRREISYTEEVKGRVTGLVTPCVGIAF